MPHRLILIRHAESAFNKTKEERDKDSMYASFLTEYHKDPDSKQTRILAAKIHKKFSIVTEDHETPLTHEAEVHTIKMAKGLKKKIPLPDVIFISPYDRTKETLEHMKQGWPKLAEVPVKKDARIKEMNKGVAYSYGDWKIFSVLNPKERIKKDKEGEFFYKFPKGESQEDLKKRVEKWMNKIHTEYKNKEVMVISHKKTILAIRMIIEGLTIEEYLRLNKYDGPLNVGVTIYKSGKDMAVNKLMLKDYNLKLY